MSFSLYFFVSAYLVAGGVQASEFLLRCDVGGCGPHMKGWIPLGSCGTYRNLNGTGIDVTLSTGNPQACECRSKKAQGKLAEIESDFLFADDEYGSPGADFILKFDNLIPGCTYKLVTFHSRPDEPPSRIQGVIVKGAELLEKKTFVMQGHNCIEDPPEFVFKPDKPSVSFRFIAPKKEKAGKGAQVFLNGFTLKGGLPYVSFVKAESRVSEEVGELKIEVEAKNFAKLGSCSVRCRLCGGSASLNKDFQFTETILEFDPVRRRRFVSVLLRSDSIREGRESLTLELCDGRGAVIVPIRFHTVFIRDPDALFLPVDLALPVWGGKEPLQGTLKEGFEPFVASRWADMYSHDSVWEDGSNGTDPPPKGPGLGGLGVHVALGTGNEGQGGLHVKGMCRGNLAGDEPPRGSPVGEPIANSWYYAVDWAGDPGGDILMRINGLPAGTYELLSFHNHWEPCTQSTRNCMDCVCAMPPMPRIYATALPPSPLPGYKGWNFGPGSGKGVTCIKEARNVSPSHVLEDERVATSSVTFTTDGSDVLVIYEAGPNTYPDCARPGREGSRAILNAFIIERLDRPSAE